MNLNIKLKTNEQITYRLTHFEDSFYWLLNTKYYRPTEIRDLKRKHRSKNEAVAWAEDWSYLYSKEIHFA